MVTDCGILNRKEVIYMSIDKAIENAVASVEMEGFSDMGLIAIKMNW